MEQLRSPIQVREVIATGDRGESLRALRDRLAEELDEERAATHKRECRCTCGMGDGRVIVALVKELRAVVAELDAMPGVEGASRLDYIAGAVADEVSARRARRIAAAED